MKPIQLILFGAMAIASISMSSCKEQKTNSNPLDTGTSSIDKANLEDEAWQMEERYWAYVQNNDTISYKTLWHDDFMGYPTFGDGVSNKSKIATWIPELHADPNQIFSYQLFKKGSNSIGDVIIVFYDTDEIWTDKENNILKKETYKFTHTWKKYGDAWLILGGMAAKK